MGRDIDHDLSGVDAGSIPEELARLHRETAVDTSIKVALSGEQGHLEHVFVGAGFALGRLDRSSVATGPASAASAAATSAVAEATRLHTLADRVGPQMSLLICGLNPSPSSADTGIGFFKAGNRFWPAALAAGVVSVDRDPGHALAVHGVGMTDVVKRSTRRADEVGADEYREGLVRIRHLVTWLQPGALCLVGLAGWRAAIDRKAARGWQPESIGRTPVYLMPSTSGLNAHDTVESLADHLDRASRGTARV